MKIAVLYHSETGNTKQMAELVCEGCLSVPGIEARSMSVDEVDEEYVASARALICGCPTYEGTCSWQLKRYFDEKNRHLEGKLGGVFASQNWPGGGGASFAEMTIIAAMVVDGMIVYSGGIRSGKPFLHFGAVSTRAPEDPFSRDRCLKLGENIARKAREIFGNE